ncbi:MAG: hypothetical protein MJY46_04800 [Bacteroidales bacterium]|nr:hypothetical protein [Bacteroidales bacterium]
MISPFIQVLVVLILVAYAILLYRSRLNAKVIRTSALIILIAGTALNYYGLTLEPFVEGPVAMFFRSLFMTLEMFVYNFNLFELMAAQKQPLFLEMYILVFFAAMLTSVSAIIMLFGKRAMSHVVLFFRCKKFNHIFIGINSRSEVVARGIDNEEIAFIEFSSDTEESNFSVTNLLRGLEGDKKSNVKTSRNKVILTAKRNFKPGYSGDNVFSTIGLDRLKRLVDKNTAFYILSENADRNLDELMALLGDSDLISNTIHVCLSREGVARYYKTTMKQTGVHFIYPSSMSVVELMKSPACHPASVLKPVLDNSGAPTGAVEGEFNALVIGFGETGQAVTKFIYEFSAAINTNGTPIPTHIIVNDDRIDRLKGPFFFDNPGLGDNGIISYESLGTESSEFWTKLIERLDNLNFISISMQDDASNLDLACTIFVYAMKKRRNGLDGLKIIVRKRDTLLHERKLVERMNEKAGHEVIICYGEYEKVFTPEMIVSKSNSGINRSATALADKISAAYESVSGQKDLLKRRDESFHEKSRTRMELHQMISRANHIGTLSEFTNGSAKLSPSAIGNLARCEHLRFSRYLTAHGYSYAADDDDVFKTNHQICAWEDLTDADRKYHIDMVRAQLQILSSEN